MGAALRLAWPASFLFRQDEAEHFEFSTIVSREGVLLPHAWPSSVGIPNGPTVLYVWAAVTRFTMDPVVANTLVALLNVAALALCVPLFRRLFREERDAHFALALMATSPIAVWYSRKIWDPCLLLPLAVPAMLFTLHAMQGRRSKAVVFVPPLLALVAQAHQSAVFFAAAIGVALATRWRRLAPGWLLAGAAGAGVLSFPYVRFVLGELRGDGIAPSTVSAWPDIDVVTNLLLDISGHNLIQVAGTEAPEMLMWPFPPVGALVWLAALVFFPLAIAGYVEIVRPTGRAALGDGARALLLAVTVGVPAAYLAARVRGVPHYFLAFLPLLLALVPIGWRRLARAGPAWRRAAVRPAVLVALNLAAWTGFLSYVVAHQGSESYGLPYARIVAACGDVAARASELGRGAPEDPLVLAVDIPRDRGPLPVQYAFVLRHRYGVETRAPAPDEVADVVLRVRWTRAGLHPEPPWSLREP